MSAEAEQYEIVIRPNRGWLHIDFKGIWQYRDLLLLLVYRDFASKYKQTILGPLWFIIQPVLTTLVFTVIFGKVAKISTDGTPPILFYLCGLMVWNYFAQTFTTNSNTLGVNVGIFGKVYFPRVIPSLAVAINNLMMFAIQFATFLAFFLYFKLFTNMGGSFQTTGWVLLMPMMLLVAGIFSLGCGLWMTSLTVRYKDFQHLSGFIIQLWMYATPIVYPLSAIPEKWRWVVALNPMTTVVESFKLMFLGQGIVDPFHLVLCISMSLMIFITGLLYFQKVERSFVDSV